MDTSRTIKYFLLAAISTFFALRLTYSLFIIRIQGAEYKRTSDVRKAGIALSLFFGECEVCFMLTNVWFIVI